MDKKVIEQGESFLDIQHLTKTIVVYEKFHLNTEGNFILILNEKATEVAKTIDPNYQKLEEERDGLLEALKDAKQTLAIIDTMVISSPIKNTCKKRISEIDQAIKQSEG